MKHVCDARDESLTAFKKARSSLERVVQMAEKGEYCIDIMQQNLAVIGLLRSAHEKLMENHLHTCFLNGMETGNHTKKNQMIEEIQTVIKMGNK